MSEVMPELGQMLFSNGGFHRHRLDYVGETGLSLLAEAIAEKRGDGDGVLVGNSGGEPFENDTFAMRAYCWCEGDGDHEDGCPPNFEYKPLAFSVCWYKHVGRGATQSRPLSRGMWLGVLRACLESL